MKNSIRLFAALCITYICPVLSQNNVKGSCDQFGRTQMRGFLGFLQNQYMGRWFIQRTYDYSDVKGVDCMTSIYTAISPGNATIIEESIDLDDVIYNRIDSLMVFKNRLIGHYTYKIPEQGVYDWPIDIISTDYHCYSIEWSCKPKGSTSDCHIWVMSRNRYPSREFNERVNKILNDHNIDIKSMRNVIQDEDVCTK